MKKFLAALLTLCLLSVAAFAQQASGRLNGTVVGPDGNVAGATITAKDNQTGKEQTIQASGDGTFSIPQLAVGTYTVASLALIIPALVVGWLLMRERIYTIAAEQGDDRGGFDLA